MLLEDFTLDDFSRFSCELLLSAWDQALPFPAKYPHRLAWVKEHLDRDPIGEPADGGCNKWGED